MRDVISAATPVNAIQYAKENGMIWMPKITSELVKKSLKTHDEYGSFVVKTHSRFTDEIGDLVHSGIAKLTFNYRVHVTHYCLQLIMACAHVKV